MDKRIIIQPQSNHDLDFMIALLEKLGFSKSDDEILIGPRYKGYHAIANSGESTAEQLAQKLHGGNFSVKC